MTTTVSARPSAGPRELTRVGDRISFVYLERCTIHRDANAIIAEDAVSLLRFDGHGGCVGQAARAAS